MSLAPYINRLAFVAITIIGVKEDSCTLTLKEIQDRVEQALIEDMLVFTGDNQSDASRRLGMSRTGLRAKLKEYKKDKGPQCLLCDGYHGNNSECQRND